MTRPARGAAPRSVRFAAALAGLALGAWGCGAGPPPGPGPGAVDGVAIEFAPDTVRVGEPFTLGVTVRRSEPGEVAFPGVLPLPDRIEQRGAVDVRPTLDRREWRGYYTLVAWHADLPAVPPFELDVRPDAGAPPARIEVTPPPLAVLSVLPADTEGLELKDPRPFLRIRTTWWPWVLLAALLAALTWWWWRRRRRGAGEAEAPIAPSGPADEALATFARLRRQWDSGVMSEAEFYDGLELALGRYVRATRAFAPGWPLRSLGASEPGLARALRYSTLARFARLAAHRSGPTRALDEAEDWVRNEVGRQRARGADGRSPELSLAS